MKKIPTSGIITEEFTNLKGQWKGFMSNFMQIYVTSKMNTFIEKHNSSKHKTNFKDEYLNIN